MSTIDEKIGELEDALRKMERNHHNDQQSLRSENHKLKVLCREMIDAASFSSLGVRRALHAIKLTEHLINGPGVMLEEPKRAAWLAEHPWPED